MEKDLVLQKISDQMDMLISLFKLAYSDKISEGKKKVFEDKIMSEIIEAVPEDLTSGELVSRVSHEVKQSERTIRARLSDLVSIGVLRIEKVGKNSFYRSTGLI